MVARQLEGQWEAALQSEARVKGEYARFISVHPVPLSVDERGRIRPLAEDIPALWHAPTTTTSERQAIVRQLIEQVVINVQGRSEQVILEVQWAGGHRTELTVIRPIGRLECLSYCPELIRRVAALWIAGQSVKVPIAGKKRSPPRNSPSVPSGRPSGWLAIY